MGYVCLYCIVYMYLYHLFSLFLSSPSLAKVVSSPGFELVAATLADRSRKIHVCIMIGSTYLIHDSKLPSDCSLFFSFSFVLLTVSILFIGLVILLIIISEVASFHPRNVPACSYKAYYIWLEAEKWKTHTEKEKERLRAILCFSND
jgi:hypothetical protein